jgi:hypothetical protein
MAVKAFSLVTDSYRFNHQSHRFERFLLAVTEYGLSVLSCADRREQDH